MGKDLDFWKNRVSELEEECAEKQNDIDKLESDNENLKNEIAKLKQHLKSKENEEIPFADEQYEEDLLAELQDRHQQDCIEINRLNTVIDVLIDKHSRLRQQIGL